MLCLLRMMVLTLAIFQQNHGWVPLLLDLISFFKEIPMLGECSSGQPSLWRIVAKRKLLIRSIVLCHGMPKCKYVYAT